jgi:hypothetical protein
MMNIIADPPLAAAVVPLFPPLLSRCYLAVSVAINRTISIACPDLLFLARAPTRGNARIPAG